MTPFCRLYLRSMSENYVGPELGKYMAEALKVNKTLTSVKYVS